MHAQWDNTKYHRLGDSGYSTRLCEDGTKTVSRSRHDPAVPAKTKCGVEIVDGSKCFDVLPVGAYESDMVCSKCDNGVGVAKPVSITEKTGIEKAEEISSKVRTRQAAAARAMFGSTS